jgi:uncharacterized protein YndB with AHSA1/START domain
VRVAHSESIAASPARVWLALCDPAEVATWDATVVEALDAPADYPRAGQHVRWRCHGTNVVLHDRPQRVEPERLLHSLLDFGRQHLDETYRLTEIPEGTRLDLEIFVTVRVPVVGPLLARWRDKRQVIAGFQTSMANLKRHCEGGAG